MAVDFFMLFINQQGVLAASENQSNEPWMSSPSGTSGDPFVLPSNPTPKNYFEIDDWDLSSSQTLSLGSQSSGAGAGKVTFNPLSITRRIDKFSQTLFTAECQGTTFKYIDLLLVRSGGGNADASASQVFAAYRFGLVAVKTIDWSANSGDEAPLEVVTFEYGALQVAYRVQNSNGSYSNATISGWDRIKNAKT